MRKLTVSVRPKDSDHTYFVDPDSGEEFAVSDMELCARLGYLFPVAKRTTIQTDGGKIVRGREVK